MNRNQESSYHLAFGRTRQRARRRLAANFKVNARRLLTGIAAGGLVLGYAAGVVADGKGEAGAGGSGDAHEQVEKAIERAAHLEAVSRLVVARDISIPYEYIATLMRLPNASARARPASSATAPTTPRKPVAGST